MTLTERQQQIISYTRSELQAECLQLKLTIDRRSSNAKLQQALLDDINVGYYQPLLTTVSRVVVKIKRVAYQWLIKSRSQGRGFAVC